MLVGLLNPLSGTKHSFFPSQECLLLQASKLVPPCLEKGAALQGLTGATTPFPKTTYIQDLLVLEYRNTDLGFTARHLVRAFPGLELPMVPPETSFTISSWSTSPSTHFCSLIPCKYSPSKQISNQSQLSGESHLDIQHL